MEICNELTGKCKINYCLISRIIKGDDFEIARHYKGGIACNGSLLNKMFPFLIKAWHALLAAKISGCRKIQKVDI